MSPQPPKVPNDDSQAQGDSHEEIDVTEIVERLEAVELKLSALEASISGLDDRCGAIEVRIVEIVDRLNADADGDVSEGDDE